MNFDFNKEITLENEFIKLAPLQEKHLQDLLPIALENPKLLQYSPSLFGTEIHLKNYIESALEPRSEKLRYPFIIFDKKAEKYVGSTSFGNISNKDLRLEIGWTWLDKKVQGTGLNKRCKFLLLSFVFEKLKFERLELKTDARNQQSRKAIEKIGGKLEGELRSHILMTDGHRRDTVYYSILKNEWENIKKTIFEK